MSPTPGAVLRRIGSAWNPEGSYILQVATLSALPALPETDGVFAFTKDTQRLYVSKAAAWVLYTGGAASQNLDSLTDVTITSPADGQVLTYNAAQAQWINSQPFPMVHQGRVTGVLGSQTVGGVRDICVSTMPASFPYQVNIIGMAIAEWGFGSGNTSCNGDVFALLNGSLVDNFGAQFCNGGYWARTPLTFAYTINAGSQPNCKLRIGGLNLSGANCYFQGSLAWTAFRMTTA